MSGVRAAFIKGLMKIHSNPPILDYGFDLLTTYIVYFIYHNVYCAYFDSRYLTFLDKPPNSKECVDFATHGTVNYMYGSHNS